MSYPRDPRSFEAERFFYARHPFIVTDAEVREYALRSATRAAWESVIRWLPLLISVLAFGIISGLVAPVKLSTTQGPSGAGRGYGGNVSNGTASSSALGASGASSAAGGGGASSTQGGSASSGGAASSSLLGAALAGAAGLTKTGIQCGPGVKQFTFSVYAPPCVPAFHGNNGGNTAPGVTADTITITFAIPPSSATTETNAFAGAANVDVPAYIQDMNTYINFFNSQFELYGRHVVLKPFQAQGNFLTEDAGQGAAAAQADAETARSIPAFADVTFPVLEAIPYVQYLAENHVIAMGGVLEMNDFFNQFAPYIYSITATGNAAGAGYSYLLCERLYGLPAVFSPQFSNKTRVFGFIAPDTPQYQAVVQYIMNLARQTCGATFAVTEYYTLGDLESYQNQALNIIAKMKSSGVTTIVCGCDPVFPIQLSQAAAQQNYYPEWLAIGWGDPITQEYNQSEWAHAISEEGQSPPPQNTEAYKVFLMASGGRPPAEQYFYVAYYELLQFFSALQLAGPDLTPYTFEQGWFSYPRSPVGEDGVWQGGQGVWSLTNVTTGIGWWDPNAISYADNKQGAWEDCENGKLFYLQDPNSWGPAGTQLHCFGR